MDIFPDSLSLWPRLALVLGMVVAAHICVRIIHVFIIWKNGIISVRRT